MGSAKFAGSVLLFVVRAEVDCGFTNGQLVHHGMDGPCAQALDHA
jgi:hypothetical protein